MDLENAISFVLENTKNEAEQFDVIASKSHSEGISLFQSQVQNTEISDSVGIGIRVIKDGHPGYAHTERLTKEALQQSIKDALCHTAWTESVKIELPIQSVDYNGEANYSKDLEQVDLLQIKEHCLELEKLTFSKSKYIENIPYLGGDLTYSESYIANSNGLFYKSKSNGVSIGVGAVASCDGVKKLGSCSKSRRSLKFIDIQEISSIAAQHAVELFGAKKILGGKIPVILSERISGRFLRLFSSPYLSDFMQKGQSKIMGKEGSKIASEKFSLWSVANDKLFQHHYFYDSEGVSSRLVKIVDKGIFNEGLYNLETASKENRPSTGNGARDFGSKMSTAFCNMYVPCGDFSNEELLKLFPQCLLVVRLEGNSGCNAISGEFSIGAHGFWCENGQIAHPVDGVTLSGNYFDFIQKIIALGNSYDDEFSGTKVPALAIESLSVSN